MTAVVISVLALTLAISTWEGEFSITYLIKALCAAGWLVLILMHGVGWI